jgi:hypothetical protein
MNKHPRQGETQGKARQETKARQKTKDKRQRHKTKHKTQKTKDKRQVDKQETHPKEGPEHSHIFFDSTLLTLSPIFDFHHPLSLLPLFLSLFFLDFLSSQKQSAFLSILCFSFQRRAENGENVCRRGDSAPACWLPCLRPAPSGHSVMSI